jgi:drug/metabolite transporter (DMT)-like permease
VSVVNPALLIGALSSVLFGAGDFAGGIAAKRGPAPLVTAFSGLGALAVLLVGMPFTHGVPTTHDLAWGAAAGVCGALGATLIYQSLALGPVVVASPVFCVIGLIVPVLFGVLVGERPSPLAWIGVALAPFSLPLLSWSVEGAGGHSREHLRRTLLVAVSAGLVVGWFLICVARIGGRAGLMPLVVARLVAMALILGWYAARRRPLAPPPAARPGALGAGALDSAANVAYWFAVHGGPIALMATLVSLAPATTIVLGRVVLRERWSGPQRYGMGLALAAIVCISLG